MNNGTNGTREFISALMKSTNAASAVGPPRPLPGMDGHTHWAHEQVVWMRAVSCVAISIFIPTYSTVHASDLCPTNWRLRHAWRCDLPLTSQVCMCANVCVDYAGRRTAPETRDSIPSASASARKEICKAPDSWIVISTGGGVGNVRFLPLSQDTSSVKKGGEIQRKAGWKKL